MCDNYSNGIGQSFVFTCAFAIPLLYLLIYPPFLCSLFQFLSLKVFFWCSCSWFQVPPGTQMQIFLLVREYHSAAKLERVRANVASSVDVPLAQVRVVACS